LRIEGITPGSIEEKKTVSFLKSALRELLDQVYYVDVPVYAWSWSCLVEINGSTRPCVLLPYSLGVDLTVNPSEIVRIEDITLLDEVNVEDKVVLLSYPRNHVELRLITNIVAEKNPRLILLNTGITGLLKADVVLGSTGFTYTPTSPLKTPVVCLDEASTREMLSHGGRVLAKSSMEKTTGNIIAGYLNGSGEDEVHVTAHHDNIIGAPDSTPSQYLIKIAENLGKANLPVNIVFVSYTSREIGDLEFTEYHYNWGERYLLSILENKGELEKTLYAVSIGPLNMGGELLAMGHLVLREYLPTNQVIFSENTFHTESHSYMEHGVPSVTFTTLNSLKYRNTNIVGSAGDSGVLVGELVDLLKRLLSNVKPRDEWIRVLREHSISVLGDAVLSARIEATRLMDLMHQLPLIKGVKTLTKTAYTTFYYYCLQPFKAHVESALWCNLARRNLDALSQVLGTCRKHLVIGDEYKSLKLNMPSVFGDQYLDLILESTVKNLRSIINNELFKTTCIKLMRCYKSVEENHRDR
jgi:Iap family predicted aminopeptidase